MPIYVGTPTQNKKIKDIFVGMAGDVPVKVIEAWTDRGKIYDGSSAYFVACNSDGALYYSINGVEWERARSFDKGPIRGVTYGLGKFVAVGSGGMVYYSDDGKLWKSKEISEKNLYGIVYGENKFVTVGDNGVAYWSNDGIHWNSSGRISKTNGLKKITYGNGVYVAVDGSKDLYYSPDGKNWEISASLNLPAKGVTFGGNRFIAVGDKGHAFYSNDGLSWQKTGRITNSTDTLAEIKYICHGMFITTGRNGDNGVAYITTNGEQWQAITGMENTTRLNSITSGPNPTFEFGNYPIMAVMVGDDGVVYWRQGPDSHSALYQEDWRPCQGISTGANFYSVAYRSDGGHFREE